MEVIANGPDVFVRACHNTDLSVSLLSGGGEVVKPSMKALGLWAGMHAKSCSGCVFTWQRYEHDTLWTRSLLCEPFCIYMQDPYARVGRLMFPFPLVAFPFYLWKRSPGKQGSHYDPNCDLFAPHEAGMVCASCNLHLHRIYLSHHLEDVQTRPSG